MTTIATDGKSMAGDGLANAHGTIVDRSYVKVWRTPGGALIGCAGIRADALAFFAWKCGGDRPKIKKSFEALVLLPSGSLTYCCETDLDGCESEAPTAIGSGMDFAFGAMDAGASPERAVEIAGQRNPYTGGTITVLHLESARAVA
jgi:ATP-dependent HslUV protease subunit HslV